MSFQILVLALGFSPGSFFGHPRLRGLRHGQRRGGGGGAAPYITTQPMNQTVTAGQTATFTVVARGTAPLSYQWQKNSANIAGATSSSYTTPATTTADSASTFDVIVSNSAGMVTSNAATLTVNASAVAPTITTQPANQTVTAGQTATFSVVASGTAPLSYQWQKNSANIAGATSSSCTTAAATTAESGSTFDVIVSNSAGTVTSNAATLTVNPSSGLKFPIKVSAKKRYFVDANGNPWLIVADAMHRAISNMPTTSYSIYLNDRAGYGFNAIDFFAACANTSTCPSSGAANDGTLPFTSGSSPSNYDFATPNDAYWSKVDTFIQEANNLNMVVLLRPLPWGNGWAVAFQNNGATKSFNLGAYLGNRYKGMNIIWGLGQDFDGGGLPSSSNMSLMAQFMAGILSADPNHLMTCQLNYSRSYSQQGNGINSTYAADLNNSFVYSYCETYDEVLVAYNASPTMPVFLGEANYETGNNTNQLSSPANAFITRMEMWWPATSGGDGERVWERERRARHLHVAVESRYYRHRAGTVRSCIAKHAGVVDALSGSKPSSGYSRLWQLQWRQRKSLQCHLRDHSLGWRDAFGYLYAGFDNADGQPGELLEDHDGLLA